MTKLLILFFITLLVGVGFAWLADHPGNMVINWQGWEVETSLAVLISILAIFIGLIIFVQFLWNWLRHDMPFIGPQRTLRKQRRGLEAMNGAVLAISNGQIHEATKLITKAKRLLPPQPMLNILEIQAAQLVNDTVKIKSSYEALLKDNATSLIGIKGLYALAQKDGTNKEKLRLINAAKEMAPKDSWVFNTHFEYLVGHFQWREALELLKSASVKQVSKEKLARYQMVLNYCLAKDTDLAGRPKEARSFAEVALKIDMSFEPLVVLMAKFYRKEGQIKKAERLIERAWRENPSKTLADAYESLVDNERPAAQLKRFEYLISFNKNHAESKIQRAEKALAADDYAIARPIIEAIIAKNNEPRAFELKAKLLQKEGVSAAEVDVWRAKGKHIAQKAPFYCQVCYAPQTKWHHHCKSCGSFDSMVSSDKISELDLNKHMKTIHAQSPTLSIGGF